MSERRPLQANYAYPTMNTPSIFGVRPSLGESSSLMRATPTLGLDSAGSEELKKQKEQEKKRAHGD